ncbi:protein of unknown function [Clostridium beijerinckii]|nr:protein of unknown function [Clostridium beijerinckii]
MSKERSLNYVRGISKNGRKNTEYEQSTRKNSKIYISTPK